MKLYIAGPMTGLPFFNFAAFDHAAKVVRSFGHEAINPADMDRDRNPLIEHSPGFAEGDLDALLAEGFDWHAVIGEDLRIIIVDAEGIVMLPGWENSRGAGHEKYVAEATGKTVFYLATNETDFYLSAVDPRRPEVIGLMGFARVGKDTVASILVDEHGFTRVAFADALRDMLYGLNPLIHQAFAEYGGRHVIELQLLVDKLGWEAAKVKYPHVRELLQRMGTEAGRQVLGQSIWVDTALAKVQPGGKYVFTDVRFPNEAQAITDLGGKLWRVQRPGYKAINDHPSETATEHIKAHMRIVNDRTIEDLSDEVALALSFPSIHPV